MMMIYLKLLKMIRKIKIRKLMKKVKKMKIKMIMKTIKNLKITLNSLNNKITLSNKKFLKLMKKEKIISELIKTLIKFQKVKRKLRNEKISFFYHFCNYFLVF
jgi:hypothetical protein